MASQKSSTALQQDFPHDWRYLSAGTTPPGQNRLVTRSIIREAPDALTNHGNIFQTLLSGHSGKIRRKVDLAGSKVEFSSIISDAMLRQLEDEIPTVKLPVAENSTLESFDVLEAAYGPYFISIALSSDPLSFEDGVDNDLFRTTVDLTLAYGGKFISFVTKQLHTDCLKDVHVAEAARAFGSLRDPKTRDSRVLFLRLSLIHI